MFVALEQSSSSNFHFSFELSNPFIYEPVRNNLSRNNMSELVARDSFICYSTCDGE